MLRTFALFRHRPSSVDGAGDALGGVGSTGILGESHLAGGFRRLERLG